MKNSFFFLKQIDQNEYIESYGIDFEDFAVGQVFEHRPGKTFTEAECERHARRSLDLTPPNIDRLYEQKVYGERRRVMESYAISSMALTTKTFGKVVANLSMTDIQIKPIYINDTVYYESRILDKRESKSRPDQGLLHVSSMAKNQHGDVVISFARKLLVYRRGFGPYTSAGY